MKDDLVYLEHIRDALLRGARYTAGGHHAFLADEKTQDAVVRGLEVVGAGCRGFQRERPRHFEGQCEVSR